MRCSCRSRDPWECASGRIVFRKCKCPCHEPKVTRRGFISMIGAGLVAGPGVYGGIWQDTGRRSWLDPVVREGDPISLLKPREPAFRGVAYTVHRWAGDLHVSEHPLEISRATQRALADLVESYWRGSRISAIAAERLRAGEPVRLFWESNPGSQPAPWLEHALAAATNGKESRADEPGGERPPGSVLPLPASTVALGVGHCPRGEGEHSLGVERPAG